MFFNGSAQANINQTIQLLQQINVISIQYRCWDLNPRPLKHLPERLDRGSHPRWTNVCNSSFEKLARLHLFSILCSFFRIIDKMKRQILVPLKWIALWWCAWDSNLGSQGMNDGRCKQIQSYDDPLNNSYLICLLYTMHNLFNVHFCPVQRQFIFNLPNVQYCTVQRQL